MTDEFERNVKQFFWLAREREQMRLLREAGAPAPWTEDAVLSSYRFCNVHRRDDRVSKWIIENLYGEWSKPLHWSPTTIIRLAVAARWFNKIETLAALKTEMFKHTVSFDRMAEILHGMEGPHFGSAYIIQSPTGKSKIDGILSCIQTVWKHEYAIMKVCEHGYMEGVHKLLMEFPHLGPFMAYQIVCDLTYTIVLEEPKDRMTWTCAGPGAARGLGWLLHDDPSAFNYNGQKDQLIMRAAMQDVLKLSREEPNWRQARGPWELATVQHWSCEYDKWRRGCAGERLKRRFEL